MKKYEKEVQQSLLNSEEEVIKELEKTYKTALKDINGKIEGLMARQDADMQHVIYQVEYQKALKKEIEGILDVMNTEQFSTISDYLVKCYEEGFIGTMYSLQQQGIPLCFPLDQEAIVQAVTTNSKIKDGLYNHLGENVSELKKTIASEVSRGISTGASYSQVAKQISQKMIGTYKNHGGSLAYAERIARTEGHRIQVQSAMDACYKAKEKGADIVKQWDATLDKRTRDSHARVDGEIRELDEKFSNGLKFPSDPSGGAAEVVNCRCALLQRAKWALDEDELQALKDRAAFYGLDKTKNFEDYKKKYLKVAEDPYVNMSFMQKKELIHTNEQKIKRLRNEKKQAELDAIMATSADDMGAAFAKGKNLQKQIDEIAIENDKIQKALGLPTNAKERFFAQNIDFKKLPQDIRPEDRDAISSWTRNEYLDINKYMRYGDKGVMPKAITDAHTIEKCLDRNVVQEPFTVKRGINVRAMDNWFGGKDWRKEGFNPNGTVIVDKGFCATSPALSGGFGGDVMAYIDVPAGAKGAYIANMSGAKLEEEFLLQCGTFFRFDRIEITYDRWNEPHYDVFLEVIVDAK